MTWVGLCWGLGCVEAWKWLGNGLGWGLVVDDVFICEQVAHSRKLQKTQKTFEKLWKT